jgi:hypothetical protein
MKKLGLHNTLVNDNMTKELLARFSKSICDLATQDMTRPSSSPRVLVYSPTLVPHQAHQGVTTPEPFISHNIPLLRCKRSLQS